MMNKCIICHEYTENLIENSLCDCKFYFHINCYLEWLQKNNNEKCLMCTKKIEFYQDYNKFYYGYQLISKKEYENLNKIHINIKKLLKNIHHNLTIYTPKKLYLLVNLFVKLPNYPIIFKWVLLNNINTISLLIIPNYGIIYYDILNKNNLIAFTQIDVLPIVNFLNNKIINYKNLTNLKYIMTLNNNFIVENYYIPNENKNNIDLEVNNIFPPNNFRHELNMNTNRYNIATPLFMTMCIIAFIYLLNLMSIN